MRFSRLTASYAGWQGTPSGQSPPRLPFLGAHPLRRKKKLGARQPGISVSDTPTLRGRRQPVLPSAFTATQVQQQLHYLPGQLAGVILESSVEI